MSNRRKIGADFLITDLFDKPPKITKDIPKFLADVQVYMLNVLGEYGAWKTPSLEWLELENNIFGDAEEPDFTIPAKVLIAQKILGNIQFAKSFYKKGKIDKACFYIGAVVELINTPIKSEQHRVKCVKNAKEPRSKRWAVKLADHLVKANPGLTFNEYWKRIPEDDELLNCYRGEEVLKYNKHGEPRDELKRESFRTGYIVRAKKYIKQN